MDNMKKLKSFHNKTSVKKKYLDRVKAHEKADEIIKGAYWQNGKGCAVGCTIEGNQIESSYHKAFERELGIPEWLAHLEDTLFEELENGEAKVFPRKFLEAIKVGSDLSLVKPKFLLWNLENLPKNYESRPDCKKAIDEVISILQDEVKGKKVKEERKEAAESAARSAARSAAWSAAWSVESAARSAESAADSAAWSAARSAHYSKMADKLLQLLRGAK